MKQHEKPGNVLKRSHDRYRQLLDAIPDAILVYWEEKIVYANAAAMQMCGALSNLDLVGVSLLDFVHRDSQKVIEERIQKVLVEKKPMLLGEQRLLRLDGSVFEGELSAFPTVYECFPALQIIIRDITRQKKAEEKLYRLSHAVEQSGESMLITDKNGIIEHVNPAFTRIFGYAPEDVIGKSTKQLMTSEEESPFYKRFWESIVSGKDWQGTVTDRRKDGRDLSLKVSVLPIVDTDGKSITHYVGTQQDMTDQKLLEEQLRQSQKMEALGTLVGGIAHDFNNMLGGVTGNIYLAKAKARSNPDLLRNLDNVENLCFRATDMIKQLMAFARKGLVQMQQISLAMFVKEALKLVKVSVPENIELKCDIHIEDDVAVQGDATQLQQILMNLISNAIDAVSGQKQPCIKVSLSAFEADAGFKKAHPELASAELISLTVADNGNGIVGEHLDTIFDPFFTTKDIGKGTGLGLAMVCGAVQSHGGVIDVESELGRGTSFHVYLPQTVHRKATSDEVNNFTPIPSMGETILLVDDDGGVRTTNREVLESLGYRVLEAGDGKEALHLFAAHQEEVSLVMLDVVMPNMGGVEAAERIRELKPTVPVIFSTGYNMEQVLDPSWVFEHTLMLNKPVPINGLSKSIRKLLNESGS